MAVPREPEGRGAGVAALGGMRLEAEAPGASAARLLAALLVVGVLGVLFAAQAMGVPSNHDEEQYVAGGYFARDLALYRDFIHLQVPDYPLALAAVYRLLDLDGYFYLTARILNFGFTFGTLVILCAMALRGSRSVALAVSVVLLFAGSEIVVHTSRWARNDVMPMFFAVLGVWLFWEANRRAAPRVALNLVAGLALAVSAGAKVSYFFAPLVVGLYAVSPAFPLPLGPRLRRVVTPLVLGGLLGSVPILYFALTDFEAFRYSVYGYHVTGPIEYYTRIGQASRLSTYDLVGRFFEDFTRGTVLGAGGLALFLLIQAGREGRLRDTLAALRRSHGLLVLALVVVAVPSCLIPRPNWPQYFLPAIPFLALSVGVLFAAGDSVRRSQAIPAVLAVSLVTAVPGLVTLAEAPLRLGDRTGWAGLRVHEIGRRIAAELGSACLAGAGKVATLSPMYVLDGGGAVYPEFATGPFFYRTADLMAPERVRRLHGLSPRTLEAFLESDMPVAVFTGFEPTLDGDLERFAAGHGYRRVDADLLGGKLYLAPRAEPCPKP